MIEVTSITLSTTSGPVIIPLAPESPLRCSSKQELEGMARTMESRIRVLLRVVDGRLFLGSMGLNQMGESVPDRDALSYEKPE